MDVLGKHIEKHFGSYANVMHEMESPDIHLDICIIDPTPERNYYTLITRGMGAYRMKIPKKFGTFLRDRSELLITLPPNWEIDNKDEKWHWPIQWLANLARLPLKENSWLGYGHTIENNGHFAENTELCCILLSMPYFFDTGATYCKLPNGDEVIFYQMIPVYKDEMRFVIDNGADALEDRFPDDFDMVVNVNRPSIV